MIQGPWTDDDVNQFLRASRLPVRLSVVAPSGYPIVASHWFDWDGSVLRCGMPQSSRLAQALRRNPKCAFEIAADTPPYKGVRGQGDAYLTEDVDLENLKSLIVRYLGDVDSSLAKWLLKRTEPEVIVSITPKRLMTWDYSERMSDAVS